jgi:hypothetical protein
LSGRPTNLAYSEDEMHDQEYITEELIDFENYCRLKLTGSIEVRKPTTDEVSDNTEHAALEVISLHEHIQKIYSHYNNKKVVPINQKNNVTDTAWLKFWSKEYEQSLQRLVDLRTYFEGIYDIIESSGYGDDMIRRDMDDLWTHEWFHNREKAEKEGK